MVAPLATGVVTSRITNPFKLDEETLQPSGPVVVVEARKAERSAETFPTILLRSSTVVVDNVAGRVMERFPAA